MKTEISGGQIAYIYLLTIYEIGVNQSLVYGMDFIQGDETRAEDGVNYPVWNLTNGKIPISLKWTPRADGVCNGEICSFAWLEPETYGVNKGDIIYSTAGQYIFAEDDVVRDARMFFRNDTMQMSRITGYTGSPASGVAVSPITPAVGDSWQFIDTWMERSADGKLTYVYHVGNKIPFGSKPFYFGQTDPTEGQYRIAIVVEDMDGNQYSQVAALSIEK